MIIYGTRAAHLNSAQPKTAKCPSCGTQGSMVFSIFRRHVHIFWIPVFPIGKIGAAQCQHCGKALKAKEIPQESQSDYQRLKSESRGPIWQFAGLVIILALVLFIQYSSGKNKELREQYFESPQSGDVYEYKIETGRYSTFKIMSVAEDSIIITHNDYEMDKSNSLYKIDKESNYSEDIYSVSRKDIADMYTSGEILDINRN